MHKREVYTHTHETHTYTYTYARAPRLMAAQVVSALTRCHASRCPVNHFPPPRSINVRLAPRSPFVSRSTTVSYPPSSKQILLLVSSLILLGLICVASLYWYALPPFCWVFCMFIPIKFLVLSMFFVGRGEGVGKKKKNVFLSQKISTWH